MKAILEYNLDDADDRMAHMRAVKSLDMACALFEIGNNLNKNMEHKLDSVDAMADSGYVALSMIMDEINAILNENNINIDELIN